MSVFSENLSRKLIELQGRMKGKETIFVPKEQKYETIFVPPGIKKLQVIVR